MSDYTPSTPRHAFLELGSTSIKFYVVPAGGESAGQVEYEEKVPWELGYDVFEHGRISPRSVAHCLRTLRRFQERFPEIRFESVPAIGTAALREAQNIELFERILWDELRLRLQIIEGGVEAFLLETGFRDLVESYPTGLFDLGGGSLELIEYLSPASTRKTSVPVGAIRLHCRLRRTRDLFEYIREGRRLAEETLREYFLGAPPHYPELVGTGGTVRTVARCLGKDRFTHADLRRLVEIEVRGPPWRDLPPHRRKLLLPGLLALEGLVVVTEASEIVHRTASVKRGLLALRRTLPVAGPD